MIQLTPAEIMEKYPDLKEKLNWGEKELGLFLKCKLLDGFYDRQRRVSFINEKSLIRLTEFTNDNLDKMKVKL